MDGSKEQTVLIKKALGKIRQLKEALDKKEEREPIAIVGMSCRFPGGATNPKEYWKLLVENRESLCPPPIERWDHSLFYDPLKTTPNSIYLKESSFLQNSIRRFDAKFFGISPREAEEIDPQHRLLLELSWEALESAGIVPEKIKEKNVGVYVGIISSEYASYDRDQYEATPYYLTGVMPHMASGRIAYYYGTHGPAISIDTACSSSLVGFHLACKSLQSGESEIALVGGMNLMISPYALASLCQLGALSSDGRCKPFEASADGYGRSEGGGFIVLKRLSDALEAKDTILAVVKGSAVNHDGRSKGLTMPNREAQVKVMKQALKDAKIKPDAVSFIEAHGTGTEVGDPLEIQAIESVFSKRESGEPLPIGSVKAQIGHSEASAGLASIMKVVLCMQNQTIPAQINFEHLNPALNLKTIPAYIPTKNEMWNPKERTRIAAINSFGFSGTNAHVLLEEWNKPKKAEEAPAPFDQAPYFLPISAKSMESLQEYVRSYLEFLKTLAPETAMASIQNALCLHRSHFKYRIAVKGNCVEELIDQLYLIDNEGVEKFIQAQPTYRYLALFSNETRKKALAFVNVLEHFGFPSPILTEVDSPSIHTVAGVDFVVDFSKDVKDLKEILYQGYSYGYPILWEKVLPNVSYKQITLPNYPFTGQNYWFKKRCENSSKEPSLAPPLKGWKVVSPLSDYQHQFFVSPHNLKEVADTHGLLHVGHILEMIYSMVQQNWNLDQELFSIGPISLERPLLVGEGLHIYGVMTAIDAHKGSISLSTCNETEKEWTLRIQATVERAAAPLEEKPVFEAREHYPISRANFYQNLDGRGVHLGTSVQWVDGAAMKDGNIVASLKSVGSGVHFQRGVLDALAQLFHLFLTEEEKGTRLLVVGWEHSQVIQSEAVGPFYGAIHRKKDASTHLVGDVFLFDKEGNLAFFWKKLEMKKLVVAASSPLSNESQERIDAICKVNDPLAQKQHCTQFIKQLVGKLLNISEEHIALNESLYEIGFDSIVGIDLVHQLKTAFHVDIEMEKFFDNPTVSLCADLVVSALASKVKSSISSHPWFKGDLEDKETHRLYCFPYGAGGASEYEAWTKNLKTSCNVIGVQLPGREERSHERPFDDLEKCLDALEEVFPQDAVPFAFYGHSIGALLAYAFALRLQKKGKNVPTQLIVGAYSSPSIQPNPWFLEISERLKKQGIFPLPTLDNPLADDLLEKAIAAFTSGSSREHLEPDSSHMKKLLPSIWADLQLVQSAKFELPPLHVPICALGGKEDDRVSIEEIKAWKELTTKDFSCYEIEGDHFFLRKKSKQSQVLEIIEKTVGQSACITL